MENQARLEAELTAREAARRDALVASDLDALAELMTDDLVHVHTTGNVHDKAQLLNHAARTASRSGTACRSHRNGASSGA